MPTDPTSAAQPRTDIRILIADQTQEHLDTLKTVVESLAHEVVASGTDVSQVAALTSEVLPDLAIVTLGESSAHGLDLIAEIVREASAPVIALLPTDDHEYVREAARRGVFASIVDADREELRGAIEITLVRFAEYENLPGRIPAPRRAGAGEGHPHGPGRHHRRCGARGPALAFAAGRAQAPRRRHRPDESNSLLSRD